MNPIEQQIQNLKDALRSFVDMIMPSIEFNFSMPNEQVDEETQEMLANVMEHTAIRIQELRQQAQAPAPPTPPASNIPELDPSNLPSSTINSFRYDPKNQQLYVKFNGREVRDAGPIYKYEGIPEAIYRFFRWGSVKAKTKGSNRWGAWFPGKIPSQGAAMHELIKKAGYPYERVS